MNEILRLPFIGYKTCKVNYAMDVKLILSYIKLIVSDTLEEPVFFLLYQEKLRIVFKIEFDIDKLLGIINFTLYWRFNNVKQKKDSQRKCNTQLATAESYRSTISRSRVFRCRRFIANKIRDVAKSSTRWLAYLKGGKIIWFFKAIFLQNTYELSCQRTYWITTLQKRATKTSQIFQRDNVIYKIISYRGSQNKIICYSKQIAKQIWTSSASTKYRKSFKANEKKTPALLPITLPTTILDQYEILRTLVIEKASNLPSNYWIFINQGMLVWAEKFEQVTYKQSATITQIKPIDNSIINILANMITYAQQEKCYV